MKSTINPLLSIIMPVKNTAPYLPACIESILAQTYSNWELIAVNDHSTDNSVEILNYFTQKDERIKVYHASKPKLLPALRLGFEMSKGELIQRLDSDDALPLEKLAKLVAAWKNQGKGSIVTGKVKYFREDGSLGEGYIKYQNWINQVVDSQSHWQQIYKECGIATGSWLLHRQDFIRAGGFNGTLFPEDYDLVFRFYEQKLKVVALKEVIHLWRDRSDRITRQWEEYSDNRFFDLKCHYFYKIDRDKTRPLVLWGAGRNGKDLAKILLKYENNLYWICDNQNKVGKDIYGIKMEAINAIREIENPQIVVAVNSPSGQKEIQILLLQWGKKPVKDYWFFG